MNIAQLTQLLNARGIGIRRDGDELIIDGPDDSLTDELVNEIKAHKNELMKLASSCGVQDVHAGVPRLCPAENTMDQPLSFAQQRLWYLEQLDPGKSTYNLPFAYKISGPLDPVSFETCLKIIVERHHILRTSYRVKDGVPVHKINGSSAFNLEYLQPDLRGDDPSDLQEILLPIAMKPFDLENGPLFRVTLVQLASDAWTVLLVAHHTVFDGASIEIIEKEISNIYPAVKAGKSHSLGSLPVQYGDYAVWQANWLQGKALQDLMDHWLPKTDGTSAPLNLPIDFPYPAEQTFNGERIIGDVAPGTVTKLRDFAGRNQATLFMVLITAFFIALRTTCDEKDITIGFPVANRTQRQTENLIGFFANTLPLRLKIQDHFPFDKLLNVVRKSVIESIAYAELPFEKLVEVINPPRDLARSPIFQVLVSYQEGVRQKFSAGDLEFRKIRIPMPVSRLDISLFATESKNNLQMVLEYNCDVFEASTAERLLGLVQTVLNHVASDSGVMIGDIDLVMPNDRKMLLKTWNATDITFPADERIEQLIESASVNGEKVAIECNGTAVTYDALNRQSDRISHDLISQGVRAGDLVGIYMFRSCEMVAAMIAAMKAGAGYLPLDPDFPIERLSYMLSDSGSQVLITQPELQERRPRFSGKVISIDECSRNDIEDSPAAKHGRHSSDMTAYVLYTSGSTGRPKGVVVPHRCVSNFLRSMRNRPGLSADDVLLSVTTSSFDISVLEFFLPLTIGAKVVIADADVAADGARLKSLLEQCRATVMQATPSTWRMLLDSGWNGGKKFKALCGGEPLPQDLARALSARCGELWNLYGPTETTIWSTCCLIDDSEAPVTIGTPIANTKIYVLDEGRNLLPVGAIGEIWIGGAGVASGYLNQPELTERNFIADPYSSGPEGRMYRTGDLGRWRSDGSLQHLGRLGSQVKIRGFRIELGDIEAVLSEHASVSAVACQVWQANPGDQRLTAYVVPAHGQNIQPTECRKFLRTKLPDYMVPQFFEQIDSIPLTSNGKIDRAALNAPMMSRILDRVHVPPETDVETSIAEIWQEIIGIDNVGRHDFFFDVGGHSLLAVRAASEMEKRLGSRPHLREFILDDLSEIAKKSSAGGNKVRLWKRLLGGIGNSPVVKESLSKKATND